MPSKGTSPKIQRQLPARAAAVALAGALMRIRIMASLTAVLHRGVFSVCSVRPAVRWIRRRARLWNPLSDIPVPHSMCYYLPFMCAVGAITGSAVVIRALHGGSLSCFQLTPSGFAFADGGVQSSGSWDDVEAVAYRPRGGAHPRGNRTAQDGPVLPEAPESRDELTDGRAIERLRNEDFGRRGSP